MKTPHDTADKPACNGDRAKPEKLTVEKDGEYFVAPTSKAGQWVIFQARDNPKAEPVTARLELRHVGSWRVQKDRVAMLLRGEQREEASTFNGQRSPVAVSSRRAERSLLLAWRPTPMHPHRGLPEFLTIATVPAVRLRDFRLLTIDKRRWSH